MNRVLLRVLSGPHLGAAIELPPGLYLVGSDAEADLILAADETVAGCHLELSVCETPEGPQVTARPLSAPVALNGEALPADGRSIPPGEVLALGFTALAWRPSGDDWGSITLAPLEYAKRLAEGQAGRAKPPEPPAEPKAPVPEDQPVPDLEEEPRAGPEESALEEDAAAPGKPASAGGLGWIILLLGLIVLFMLLGFLALGDWGEGLTRRDAAERLNALLAQRGHTGVRAEPEDGALVLRGLATDDRELALMTSLAAAQPFPVRVEVRILADRLRAVRETMNARGFFPEVHLGQDGRLEITVYMKDALVEDRAFNLLETDLRGLGQADRRVVYARDLRPILEWELQKSGLGRVEADYLDGLVKLPLTPDVEERRLLGEALEKVRKNVGAPIVFQLADGRTERPAPPPPEEPPPREEPPAPLLTLNPEPDTTQSDLQEGEPELARLEIMSVTQGALPFVTLSDGQKFFIGGVLPNGATLLDLEAGHLKMALGNKIFIQTLQENQ